MKILMTNNSLDRRGGSESYLEVTASALRGLGHEVVFFSGHLGATAESLRQAGFAVHGRVEEIPRDVDVIHGQHSNAVALVRERLPATPLAFACHSWLIPIEDPVPELGAAAYLAFNDVTRRRLAAHAGASGTEIVRMRQPVEVTFADALRTPIGAEVRRAVAVSRSMRLMSDRLSRACAALGIDFEHVGGPDSESDDARREMRSADVVFAIGRTALEAMALARAVLVVDESMIGGWVSRASYDALESDGFTGREARIDEDLESLIGEYSQDLGVQARFLVGQHHQARHHAVDLMEVYTSIADSAAAATNVGTLPLILQERFAFENRAVAAEWDAARLRTEVHDLNAEVDGLRTQLEGRMREREHLLARIEGLGARLRRARTRARRFRAQRDEAREGSGKPRNR